MSIQTILAAGFCLLGGVMLLIAGQLFHSDLPLIFGLLLTLMGASPLVIQLVRSYLSWYHKFPITPTDTPKKED